MRTFIFIIGIALGALGALGCSPAFDTFVCRVVEHRVDADGVLHRFIGAWSACGRSSDDTTLEVESHAETPRCEECFAP